MKTILIMNGPNLSQLGKRDPKHYGSGTLSDLENACINKGIELGVKVQCFQSESESALIKKLHNLNTGLGIQSTRRLISKKDTRMIYYSSGYSNSLLLSTR